MSSSSKDVFKMSKAKIRRARFGKQGGGGGKKWEREPCLSPTPARFSHLFLLNDFTTILEPGTG